MGVKSWLFSIEQHVYGSLRSVLNHPGPVSESHHRLWVLSSQCCVGLAAVNDLNQVHSLHMIKTLRQRYCAGTV